MHNGILAVTLHDVLSHPGAAKSFPLVIEIKRRDGLWDREAIATSPGFNNQFHEFDIKAQGPTWQLRGRIKPDPWVIAGGVAEFAIELQKDTGTYTGKIGDRQIAGLATAVFRDKPRASLGRVQTKLAILERFQREGATSPLYDYARAGYHYGDEPGNGASLPVFRVEDFGALPDSGEETFDGIQAALDAAAAARGGVVLLPPGIFDLSVAEKRHPLRIRASNIILRGSGSGPDGTVIVNHRYSDSPDPGKFWLAGQFPIVRADGDGVGERVARVLTGHRGSAVIEVADATGLQVGATYLFRVLENEQGTLARALTQGSCVPAANYRGAGTPLVTQLVTLTGIAGKAVTVEAPLHWTLRDEWEAELLAVAMLEEIGIEHIRFRTHWDGYFVHHRTVEDDNGWDHVGFSHLQHSWTRDLVHENATSAIGLADCKNCTVMDGRILGNPGHNGFCIGRTCTGNLHLRLACGRQMHAFNLAGTICGNAIVDCQMDEPAGVDFHGGLGLDNLIDALTGGVNVGGGSTNAVPPRHAHGLTLWNWSMGHYDPYLPWRRRERLATWQEHPGFIAIGVHGNDGHQVHYDSPTGPAVDDVQTPACWVESNNQAVHPRSLYEWQRQISERP